MEPVIDPMLIYLVGLCYKVTDVVQCVAPLLAIFSIFAYVKAKNDKVLNTNKVWIYPMMITSIVLLLLLLVIPTKEITIAMLVSSCITPDNSIVEFIRKIAEAVR